MLIKKILLLIVSIFFAVQIEAQITLGQTSDFEDGTTQGWRNGAQSPNPPTNVPTGGPNGVDDNFLEEISAGGAGAGSKMIIQNTETDWTGDYTAAEVWAIFFWVKNAGATDLFLRVAMEGGGSGGEMSTTNSFSVPASQTSWTKVTIPIQATDCTIITGGDPASLILSDVNEIRILSSTTPSYNGDAIAGTMHVDYITAIENPLIGTFDTNLANVSVYPNPVSDILNVANANTLERYEIFNIAGQRIAGGAVESEFIQVSSLSQGLYFLRLSNNLGVRTIKFVKR